MDRKPDLKLGNVVAYMSPKGRMELGTIEELRPDICILKDVTEGSEKQFKAPYSELRPVKITTRWLRDNGFDEPEDIEDQEKRYIHSELPIVYCHGTRVLYALGRQIPVKVLYIHHFQNIISDYGIDFTILFKPSHGNQLDLGISITSLIGGLQTRATYFDTNQAFGFNKVILKLSNNSPKRAVSVGDNQRRRWSRNLRSMGDNFLGSEQEWENLLAIQNEEMDLKTSTVDLYINRLPGNLYIVEPRNRHIGNRPTPPLSRESMIHLLNSINHNFRVGLGNTVRFALHSRGGADVYSLASQCQDTVVLSAYIRGLILERMNVLYPNWSDREEEQVTYLFYAPNGLRAYNIQIGIGTKSPLFVTGSDRVTGDVINEAISALNFISLRPLEELNDVHYEPWEDPDAEEEDRDIVEDEPMEFNQLQDEDGNVEIANDEQLPL